MILSWCCFVFGVIFAPQITSSTKIVLTCSQSKGDKLFCQNTDEVIDFGLADFLQRYLDDLFRLGHFLFDEFLVFPRHYNVMVLLSCLHFFKFHSFTLLVKTENFFNSCSSYFPNCSSFCHGFFLISWWGKSTGSMGCQGLRHAAGGKPMERDAQLL